MKSALQNSILLLLAFTVLVAVGCRKLKSNDNKTVTNTYPIDGVEPDPIAGKGGEAVLNITPEHDGLTIDSCMVYIKYNTRVIPASMVYDDSAKAIVNDDGVPVATFRELKSGNYYLFGRGWDIIRSEKVRGGIPFKIERANARTTHNLTLQIQDYE